MTFTAAARRCAAMVAVCPLLGILLGRPDIAALAAPFAVGLVLALRRDPAAPVLRLQVSPGTVMEHERVEVVAAVTAGAVVDVAVIGVAGSAFDVEGGATSVATVVRPGPGVAFGLALVARSWGRQQVGPAACATVEALGMHRRVQPLVAAPLPVAVLPAVEAFGAGDTVPHAVVHSGSHRARAVGPGAEFAGIRPFAPGDSPRRINWPASSRAGELLTNLATTERAARVWVLLDSQYTAGRTGRVLLDVAVRAAAGVADHYLAVGDSVGLAEYGGRNRVLPPAGGRRQRALAHDWLLDVGPVSAAAPPASALVGSLRTSGALVVVLTPFLDSAAAARLVQLRRAGASVVAVDTLVDGALPPAEDAADRVSLDLWLIQRRTFMESLGDLGIPVVHWSGPGTLDVALGEVARMAAAPRVVAR